MPPKGYKAPRVSNPQLLDAWNIVRGHATFEGIVREDPQDGGACAPFDQAAFAVVSALSSALILWSGVVLRFGESCIVIQVNCGLQGDADDTHREYS